MFLYRRVHSPTPHAKGRSRRSASRSTSTRSDSEMWARSAGVRLSIEVGERGVPGCVCEWICDCECDCPLIMGCGADQRLALLTNPLPCPPGCCPPLASLSLLFLSSKSFTCSKSLGGAKLQLPWVIWYFSPLACLYDLLQFGFGHRNGFDISKEVGGR